MKNLFRCLGNEVPSSPTERVGTARKPGRNDLRQTLIAMKILLVMMAAAWLQASAKGFAQTISLRVKNVSLEKVFSEIERQTDYRFIYTREELKEARAVSIDAINITVVNLLDQCLKEQPLAYTIKEPYIIIRKKEQVTTTLLAPVKPVLFRGKIINDRGEGVQAATVTIKGTPIATATNEQGEFEFEYKTSNVTLLISCIGYEKQEVSVNGRAFVDVVLQTAVNSLDETVVMGYGKTSRRLNTGNIFKVSGEEISRQPVSNPLAALEGRVPGLVITQSSGVPGSSFKVQIRGQNSIGVSPGNLPPDDPLFIIDGVPSARGNTVMSQLTSSANNPYMASQGGLSPFNLLNPSDIESIEILKDADATAIYGSRGANGVILITTKKGKAGKTKVQANVNHGAGVVTRTMEMLDTKQYIAMRREAFQNDGTTPSTGNAPDLLVWDTTRYIDFKNLLIGGTAQMTNANVSVSGGTAGTQFLIGGNYTKETTVFPGDFADRKASFLLNLHHNSADKKFDASISAGYTVDKNNLMSSDLTGSINLPPNSPSLYDANGKLNWQENGVSISDLGFIQPLSYLLQKYTAQSDNLTGNINLSYRIIPSLVLRLSGGYNASYVNEININPQTSFDPNWGALGYSLFGYSSSKTWNAEPQLEYSKQIGKSKLSVLAGTTWQDMQYNSNTISAFGYASDILLQSISGAGSISASNSLNQYRYNALFGRVNYNLSDKYIVNLSGRRDGSSRFGPGKQFANFGAVGTAWTFSNEKFIQKALTFLSFGKLRGSYGTTGNDQIDDYSFLDLWSTTSRPYQNTQGLTPGRLFNPDYSWELNRKLEFGLEAGLLKDRILFTISYFRNRCGNQLISYILPAQTGFTGISRNFDALVQNKGWEITLNSKNIQSKDLKWSSSFVLSIPQNKLLSFPGLATSSYSLNYKVGQSLNIINRYQFLGVDPSTGIYHFKDINGDGTINRKDFVVSGNLDPKFYGGLQNSVGYKNWQLDIFFEFRKQVAQNYLASQSYYVPGLYFNQPTIVLSRWQKPGDNSTIQRFSQDFGTVFSAFASKLALSNGVFSDASYIRCKNLSLSYNIPSLWMSKIRLESARIYLQAQNLFTITNYVGSDPENHNFYVLPPLRTIVAGIQLTL